MKSRFWGIVAAFLVISAPAFSEPGKSLEKTTSFGDVELLDFKKPPYLSAVDVLFSEFSQPEVNLVIGKITSAEWRGRFHKSGEIDLSVGDVSGGPHQEWSYSVLTLPNFDRLTELEQNKPYIHVYKKHFLPQVFQQESRYEILDSYPSLMDQNPTQFDIPTQFFESESVQTSLEKDEIGYGEISGSIIKIQRHEYSPTSPIKCTATLITESFKQRTCELGLSIGAFFSGIGIHARHPASNTRFVQFHGASHEGCRTLATLMGFGKQLKITYSRSENNWFSSDLIMTGISAKE